MAPQRWNELPEESPIWGTCITTILNHYQNTVGKAEGLFPSHITQVSKVAFSQIQRAGKIKQFFQKHLLTNLDEMEQNIQAFTGGTRVNQRRLYTCLIPSNPRSLVELDSLLTNISYPVPKGGMTVDITNVSKCLKDRLERVEEFDIVLDDRLEEPSPSYRTDLPTGGGFSEGGSMIFAPRSCLEVFSDHLVELPEDEWGRESRIHGVVNTVLKEKYETCRELRNRKWCKIYLILSVGLVAGLSYLLTPPEASRT